MVASKRSAPQRKTADRSSQRDRHKKSTTIPSSYPVSNLPTGAVMDNVTAAPETAAPVQAKLTIGQVGDKYEKEADSVAAQVVNQLNSPVQKQAEEEEIQRQPGLEIRAPQAGIQRRVSPTGGSSADPQFESNLNRTLGKGQSLSTETQTQMGNAMGADFSGVTVHTDAKADGMCDAIQAKAFTTGTDVYFKQGTYQPSTTSGQELIAHELTHVVQQNAGAVQRKTDVVVQRLDLTGASRELFYDHHQYGERVDFIKECISNNHPRSYVNNQAFWQPMMAYLIKAFCPEMGKFMEVYGRGADLGTVFDLSVSDDSLYQVNVGSINRMAKAGRDSFSQNDLETVYDGVKTYLKSTLTDGGSGMIVKAPEQIKPASNALGFGQLGQQDNRGRGRGVY